MLSGLEMGVMSDGTTFCTGRGLAAFCGVVPSVINQWANEYDEASIKKRDVIIRQKIREQNHEGPIYVKHMFRGQEVNAYPEPVCMAVLEYYGFDADRKNEKAAHNFRLLARAGMRVFVYSTLGYDPTGHIPKSLQNYQKRLLANEIPRGYYSVFTETAHMMIPAIRAGLRCDQSTVPDISIGRIWSGHWEREKLADQFGERTKYKHVYPDDYAQSDANAMAWVYPLKSLGEFRDWLDREYLPKKFHKYLKGKVGKGHLPASRAELIIDTVVPKQLTSGEDDE